MRSLIGRDLDSVTLSQRPPLLVPRAPARFAASTTGRDLDSVTLAPVERHRVIESQPQNGCADASPGARCPRHPSMLDVAASKRLR